ncbi:AP superfamily protein [Salinisphaera sp. S4-8]|uniref:alkaline phosphatase family protein n=1 Tax=Salinisphaera sp. S4-8 TaxID=633357 RepID=UPI00333E2DDD
MRILVWCLALASNGCAWQAAQFWVAGEQVALRETDADERPPANAAPKLLVVAIDGIDRHLLYDMLRAGELPEMARLLGDDGRQQFAHAWFQDSIVSVLPSSTAVSWATTVTGATPAEHGVAGNEYFIRATGEYAAPVPVTIHDATPVFEIYTDGYANDLLEVPTIYQRLRETDPGVRIWVGMHQFYAGADRLILTDRTAMLDAFQSLFAEHVAGQLTGEQSLSLFEELDEEVIENMDDLIEDEPAADVITIYLPGLDHYAHIHDADPDVSRRDYLKKGRSARIACRGRRARRSLYRDHLRSRPYRRIARRCPFVVDRRRRRAAQSARSRRLYPAALRTGRR